MTGDQGKDRDNNDQAGSINRASKLGNGCPYHLYEGGKATSKATW